MIRKIIKKIFRKPKKVEKVTCDNINCYNDQLATSETDEIELPKCAVRQNIVCRMELSPVIKQAELHERVNKIQKAQLKNLMQPCYCNNLIPRDKITIDMCMSCSYKDTCDTSRIAIEKS